MGKNLGGEPRKRTFLSARWSNLLLLNYAVSPDVLAPDLPEGCELDTFSGSPYVSLVAFQFLQTRVLGIPWPGYVNFPEINLRFYIRYQGKRGVCFIREYVPSRVVAALARLLYNEPYRSARMHGEVVKDERTLSVTYAADEGGAGLRLYARAENQPYLPPEDSTEHFFKEHELGVGRDRAGRRLTYAVHHQHWRVYPIRETSFAVDPALYGSRFSFLASRAPDSVVLAEGSEITVSTGTCHIG